MAILIEQARAPLVKDWQLEETAKAAVLAGRQTSLYRWHALLRFSAWRDESHDGTPIRLL